MVSVTASSVVGAQNFDSFGLVESTFYGVDMPFTETVGLKVVQD